MTINKKLAGLLGALIVSLDVERYISGAAFGTTYKSQKPAIATVDAEGRVTAHSPGRVAIDIFNGECRTQAMIDVYEE